jgi:DNA-binding MarR family transcriptional regulator
VTVSGCRARFWPPSERDEVAEPRWLTEDEQRAWRSLVSVLLKLPVALDRQLQHDAGMSHFEYWVVAMLSEAPGHRLQHKQLAARISSSPSRLSHVMRRLEERGWVLRTPNPDDARASDAILTEDGFAQVRAAAPGHVEAVRQLVFDALTDDDVADLERIATRVLAQLEQRRSAPRSTGVART